MIAGLGGATRVYLAVGATDLRKSFEGLYGLVSSRLQEDPVSGHLFVFCNRTRTRLKVLYFDGSGLWICAKRLARGRFRWPDEQAAGATRVRLNLAELTMLLAGIDLTQSRRRRWWRREE